MQFVFKLMMYLATKWFGVFLYDNEIIDKILFPKDANEIAERIYKIQNGILLEEENRFKKYEPIVGEKRLSKIGKFGKIKKLKIMGKEYGYSISLLKEACIKAAIKKIREEEGKRERRISEAVNALDDLIKVENILRERLRDWYGFFNEFESIEDILKFDLDGNEINRLESNSIKKLAEIVVSIEKSKENLEEYIEKAMQTIAPNLTKIVGYKISARLVAIAGGLDRLAVMPSGTIQLLGAEKALFRHLKSGSPPPKHGVIFMHEMVNKAPRKKRGRIARLLATKIAIAAKADAFTHNYIADDLDKEIKRKYEEIMKTKKCLNI